MKNNTYIRYAPYHILLVHSCKMMIYPSRVFSVFQNVDFLGYGGKNGPKWQKILSVTFHMSRTIHHMIVIYVTSVWNDNISKCFFHFLKILIFRVVRRVKGQKTVQNDKKYLWNHTSYDCHLWYTCKILIFWVVKGLKG